MNAEEIVGKILNDNVIKKIKKNLSEEELGDTLEEVISDVSEIQSKIREIIKKNKGKNRK